jgi:hypothetical protein
MEPVTQRADPVLRKPESTGTQVRTKLAQLRYYEALAIIRASATSFYEFRLMLYTRQAGRRLSQATRSWQLAPSRWRRW